MPVLPVLLYPFLLRGFHESVGTPSLRWAASIALAAAFAVPLVGFIFAMRVQSSGMRRLAFASIMAPTLFVFLGVVQALVSSPLPDEWPWLAIWLGLAILAWARSRADADAPAARDVSGWRVAHGVSGAVVLLYVLFHLANHLFGLFGPAAHASVMNLGRHVYRAPLIEPVLVLLLLFQVGSGLRLAWHWSARQADFYRAFQVASGLYLAVFVLGHMNSVFIYARTVLGIQTDWAFATGAPAGLIHDAWNIRLVPHYTLGVFFVLAHVFSGLRVVLISHGVKERTANRMWHAGAVLSALIAIAIIAGMCGLRLG